MTSPGKVVDIVAVLLMSVLSVAGGMRDDTLEGTSMIVLWERLESELMCRRGVMYVATRSVTMVWRVSLRQYEREGDEVVETEPRRLSEYEGKLSAKDFFMMRLLPGAACEFCLAL